MTGNGSPMPQDIYNYVLGLLPFEVLFQQVEPLLQFKSAGVRADDQAFDFFQFQLQARLQGDNGRAETDFAAFELGHEDPIVGLEVPALRGEI